MKKLPLLFSTFALASALFAETPKSTGWDTKLTTGLSLKSGNTESESYQAKLDLGKSINQTIFAFNFEGFYAQNETTDDDGYAYDEQTEGKVKANANVKQTWDAFYVYFDNAILHDDIADIQLRNIASVGIGSFLINQNEMKLFVDVGVSCVTERSDEDDTYPAFRFGQRFDYPLNESVKVWEKSEITAEMNSFDNTLISFEAGLESAITKTLAFGVTYQIDYDTEPNEGVEKFDSVLGMHLALSL